MYQKNQQRKLKGRSGKPQGKGPKLQGKAVKARPNGAKNKSRNLQQDAEIERLRNQICAQIDSANVKRFIDLPLSKKTLKALADCKYTTPTEVQRLSIGYALQGKDVLGAAVTGSGKTLAFLIPVLEHLYVNKWSRTDGIGAIIISPTRELAYQIFETLRKIGKEHDFSAGLIIGGKNLKFERTRMDQCNILICTPGRLLQHMDENPLFNAITMEVLVLDEADRCLDMGFEKTLNAIIENFPPDRQTLLFSATQTNTVQDLARLNLRDPAYVGYRQLQQTAGDTSYKPVDSSANGAMLAVPELLQQSYVVLPLEEKITMLWSFIKNHLKQKIIVFLSSCKQVKYIYEIFCKLRPGTSLLALYGTLHQDRRIAIYEDFVRKNHVVLFATDVASRGLDFPAVNWVVQLDCPEDVSQYIHRAGRSARNKTRGESLLVLMPSEEDHMIEELQQQQINVRQIHIDPKKLFSPRIKIEAFLAQFPDLKASAQRAYLAYVKSVFLQRNKRIFNVLSLDLDAYAKSLGLAVTPRVRFLERILWRLKQQQAGVLKETNDTTDDAAAVSDSSTQLMVHKHSKQDFTAPSSDTESDDDDDFIRVKRRDHDVAAIGDSNEENDFNATAEELIVPKREKKLVTKTALAKKALRKKLQVNTKLTFDEHGSEILDTRKHMQAQRTAANVQTETAMGGIDIAISKQLLTEEDKYDKQRFRELVKKRHKLAREKKKKKSLAEEELSDEEQSGESQAKKVDEVNDDDDDDESVAESVDLSWLPDPDKIYKQPTATLCADKTVKRIVTDNHNDDDNHNEDADYSDDERNDIAVEPLKKKSKLTDKLTLNDTETIAASLLGFSR